MSSTDNADGEATPTSTDELGDSSSQEDMSSPGQSRPIAPVAPKGMEPTEIPGAAPLGKSAATTTGPMKPSGLATNPTTPASPTAPPDSPKTPAKVGRVV